ncbi:translation initiation factor IF-2, putative (IF2c) [Plasmodium ovale curtisi]|uniref:Translation initiation factor IF-2, putative (IF2c) n=1 Tax=Plasmodium ovale curtisi TaxID=864141 RepID=A0A1A8VU00_PLAOA|nr:translation initiation factor IF-2, putative (IF2c) [Plasmodium ovale curtisi]
MNKLNIKRFEDPNLWLYENVFKSSVKVNHGESMFNKDFEKKAKEKLKLILKECKMYDKELAKLSCRNEIALNHVHPCRKIDMNILQLNPFKGKSKLVDLNQFVNGKRINDISRDCYSCGLSQGNGKTRNVKVNPLLSQLKERKKVNISKITSCFANYANYYDTHLKEKYMNELLKKHEEKMTAPGGTTGEDKREVSSYEKRDALIDHLKEDDAENILRNSTPVGFSTVTQNRQNYAAQLTLHPIDTSQKDVVQNGINHESFPFEFSPSENLLGATISYVDSMDKRNMHGRKDASETSKWEKIPYEAKDDTVDIECKSHKEVYLGKVTLKNNTQWERSLKEGVKTVKNDPFLGSKHTVLCEASGEDFPGKCPHDGKGGNRHDGEFREPISRVHLKARGENSPSKVNVVHNSGEKRPFDSKKGRHTVEDNHGGINPNIYFNSLSLFEKLNKTSLYGNMAFSDSVSSPMGNNSYVEENTSITSILSHLRDKKKSTLVNTNEGHDVGEKIKMGNVHVHSSLDTPSEGATVVEGRASSVISAENTHAETNEVYAQDKGKAAKRGTTTPIDNRENRENRKKKNSTSIRQYERIDSNNITVSILSEHLNVEEEKIINVCKYILDNDYIETNTRLEKEVTELICEELNLLEKLKFSCIHLRKRNPIVTILGHVDHGKTTLLDHFRNSNVAKNEIGGITQKLGAFEVYIKKKKKKITFLDTPGHSVFKIIRKRCVQCTDLIVLVISVDDGIMSETIECIQLAKKYNIPLIVAINKIDKQNPDMEKMSKNLRNYDVITEIENGEVPIIPISAVKGINVDLLLNSIIQVSDKLNLTCDYGSMCSAYVLEKRLDPSKGKVLTVICKSGTLKINTYIIIGHIYTKIKKIFNSNDIPVKEAYPSEVVQIVCSISFAEANIKYGDLILEMSNLKCAQKVSKYKLKMAQYNLINNYYLQDGEENSRVTLQQGDRDDTIHYQDVLNSNINLKSNSENRRKKKENTKEGGVTSVERITTIELPQIHLIIKTCDEGSMEAIMEGINDYNEKEKKNNFCDITNFIDRNYIHKNVLTDEKIKINDIFKKWKPFKIITKGVGMFNSNDLKYCEYVKPCFLFSFNVDVDRKTQNMIDNNGAILRNHNIIYELFKDIENICNFYFGSLHVYEPVSKMVINRTGFYSLKKNKTRKTVISVDIKDGICNTSHTYNVLRNKEVLHKNLSILSMQKNKKSTTELTKTSNVNAIIFNTDSEDFQIGDQIVALKKVPRPPLFSKIRTFDLSL